MYEKYVIIPKREFMMWVISNHKSNLSNIKLQNILFILKTKLEEMGFRLPYEFKTPSIMGMVSDDLQMDLNTHFTTGAISYQKEQNTQKLLLTDSSEMYIQLHVENYLKKLLNNEYEKILSLVKEMAVLTEAELISRVKSSRYK